MAAPITITGALEAIWADVGEPVMVAALAASGPIGAAIASILKAPIIGPILTHFLNSFVNSLITSGVIEIKIGIIDYLSAEAQKRWADQLVILKQVSDAGETLTPEQQAAYDAALQKLVENHPGVVKS